MRKRSRRNTHTEISTLFVIINISNVIINEISFPFVPISENLIRTKMKGTDRTRNRIEIDRTTTENLSPVLTACDSWTP